MKLINSRLVKYLFLGLILVAACNKKEDEPGPQYKDIPNQPDDVFAASAVMYGTDGNLSGSLRFEQIDDHRVKISGLLNGLSGGLHAIHIHEFGSCSGKDAADAEDHYNPTNSEHGAPDDSIRHAGDLGNIKSEGGKTVIEIIDSVISLNGETSIVGRSIVIHEKADDLKSSPSGNSGRPVMCGVIGVSAK